MLKLFQRRWIRYLIIIPAVGGLITGIVLYFAVQSINGNWRRSIACTPPPYEFSEVRGYIVEADDQEPIRNATIRIHEANVVSTGCEIFDQDTQLTTDANGFFTTHPQMISFTGYNEQITITAPGCETYSEKLLFRVEWEDIMRPALLPAIFELHCTR